ncbi:hypothetical protein ACOKFD_07750 [Flagellimonas sp. S174]|uniref:dioxygenase family protein n=1 Tax=Flagellimonas sp. S174 TaxID=3410790 RepID=UPI003BF60442
MDRKDFLRNSMMSVTSLAFMGYSKKNDPQTCLTQADDLGPFFREGSPLNNNMIGKSTGIRLDIEGKIFDGHSCNLPLSNVTVEVWHASPEGSYDVSSNEYLFRSKLKTNKLGAYHFRTIMPGNYGNRPKHIHFKVSATGYSTLITQLYFENDMGQPDMLARNASNDRIIPLRPLGDGLAGTFDIFLRKNNK